MCDISISLPLPLPLGLSLVVFGGRRDRRARRRALGRTRTRRASPMKAAASSRGEATELEKIRFPLAFRGETRGAE